MRPSFLTDIPSTVKLERRGRNAVIRPATSDQLALWDLGEQASSDPLAAVMKRVDRYPRLRYMGSKYRLVPHLIRLFSELGGVTALDAFTGSGVVAYTLKAMGYAVTTNDFLAFPGVISAATVVNQDQLLSLDEIALIRGPSIDGRDFIQSTFDGLYFTQADRAFLDSAWSHIDLMHGAARSLAIAALILAAARKQPRGVFTFTSERYDDGRRDLHLPLRDHFLETAAAYNQVVFDSGRPCRSLQSDVFKLDSGYDIVYLDPPYAPPRDDNCYVKRYHFLEGLSVYWRGQEILADTKTKKLAKRYTPFSYKHTVTDAILEMFKRFADSKIVMSYSSNAVPDVGTITRLLQQVKPHVEVRCIDHRYHFGTHASATRREAVEYLFIGT